MYRFTKKGKNKVEGYIKDMEAKRKEILDAGLDTADETTLPTADDILADVNDWVDEDGYFNGWGVTDHYDADQPLALFLNEDIKEVA